MKIRETSEEKRQKPRVESSKDLFFKPEKRMNQKGVLRNISASGALIEAEQSLFPGTEVILYLPLLTKRGRETMCIVAGRVVRSQRVFAKDRFDLGIELSPEMNPATKRQIDDHVFLEIQRQSIEDLPDLDEDVKQKVSQSC